MARFMMEASNGLRISSGNMVIMSIRMAQRYKIECHTELVEVRSCFPLSAVSFLSPRAQSRGFSIKKDAATIGARVSVTIGTYFLMAKIEYTIGILLPKA